MFLAGACETAGGLPQTRADARFTQNAFEDRLATVHGPFLSPMEVYVPIAGARQPFHALGPETVDPPGGKSPAIDTRTAGLLPSDVNNDQPDCLEVS